jgi:peptide/nickel transport system permease protein
MALFLAKRLGIGLATLFLASLIVFAVLEVLPGDPARLMLGMNASTEAVGNLRQQLGLDQPLLWRYLAWAGGLLHLDLGRSYTYSVPVAQLVAERLAVSLPLALMALILSTAIALPLGVFAAARRGRAGDTLAMGATQIGVAVPNFWFALLLVYLFSVWLRLLPAGGFPGWRAGIWPGLRALLLPALALALPQAAILARVTRSALVEVLGQDFIRTARAKGVPARWVIWRHTLRNALIPIVTVIGLYLGVLIGNSVLTEIVFNRPGLGKLIVIALNSRDYPTLQAMLVIYAFVIVLANLLTDLMYGVIDPKVRNQ